MTLTARQKRRIEKKHEVTAWVDPLYRVQYYIFWHAKTNEEIRKYILDALEGDTGGPIDDGIFILPEGAGACMSYCFPMFHLRHIVFQFRDDNEYSFKIAHEAYHAANNVLGRLGVTCEEAYAYYIEYLVRRITEDMPDKKK